MKEEQLRPINFRDLNTYLLASFCLGYSVGRMHPGNLFFEVTDLARDHVLDNTPKYLVEKDQEDHGDIVRLELQHVGCLDSRLP